MHVDLETVEVRDLHQINEYQANISAEAMGLDPNDPPDEVAVMDDDYGTEYYFLTGEVNDPMGAGVGVRYCSSTGCELVVLS